MTPLSRALGLPGPHALAEIRRVVGPEMVIAVDGDHRSARDWENGGATWWLRRLPGDAAISELAALIEAGPPR